MPLIYKVVLRHQGNLVSCVVAPPWQVTYEPGKLVTGRHALFAFNTASAAMLFAMRNNDTASTSPVTGQMELWECSAPLIIDPPTGVAKSRRDYDTYWEGMEVDTIVPPVDTVLCPKGISLGRRIIPAAHDNMPLL